MSEVTCAFLRQLCEQQLPAHMVPARVLAIDELPLSGNGKVSRRQLAREPLLWDDTPEELGLVAAAWREVRGLRVEAPCMPGAGSTCEGLLQLLGPGWRLSGSPKGLPTPRAIGQAPYMSVAVRWQVRPGPFRGGASRAFASWHCGGA